MSQNIRFNNYQDISIAEFLAKLGYHPVKKSGKELFYHSMLRDTPRITPSLSVWDQGGKWIDRGGPNESGIYGGGIIQLAKAYWKDLPLFEVLKNIDHTLNIMHFDAVKPIYLQDNPADLTHSYAFKLFKTEPLGTNSRLTAYLKSRGISDIAPGHLKEIYYKNNNSSKNTIYPALGWKNEHNNWEFCTPWGFKSSIGQKGISIIEGNLKSHVVLFEGYMDYLSWLKLNSSYKLMPTAYILNSIIHLKKIMNRIDSMDKIELFLDNDIPGKQTTRMILEKYPHALDRSFLYQGYKDYNEMLMDQLNHTKIGNKR